MSLMLVLNELSHSHPAPTRTDGARRMKEFVDVLVAVSIRRSDAVLVSRAKIKSIELAEGYMVGQWASELQWREEWQKVRGMENRAPFGEAADTSQTNLPIDYFWNECPVEGLGWAHRLSGLATSFSVSPFDSCEQIALRRDLLVEQDGGDIELQSEDVEVLHVSLPSHVENAHSAIVELGRGKPESGRAMWANRDGLFPTLSFLPRVEKQLDGLLSDRNSLHQVFDRLREIDRSVSSWDPKREELPAWESKVTPESESRRALCMFNDLDDVARCFELHARFTPGCGRIHFRLDAENRRAIVAHIGGKLGS